MHLLIVFARAYPARSAIMLLCLLAGAAAEGVGFSSMLPLLSIIGKTSGAPGTNPLQGLDREDSQLEEIVLGGLAWLGLEPSVGLLLGMIVGGIAVKAGLVLTAQRQIGYTVAHVATDLRLELLRALLSARWEYYVRQPVGVLGNAFATEATRASEAYLYGTTIVALGIQAVLYLTMGTLVSWQATIGAIISGATIAWLMGRLVRMTRKAGLEQTNLQKTLLGRLTDVLYSVKPLKAMAREPLVGPLLEAETTDLNLSLQRQVLSKEAVRALQEPLLVSVLAVGLWVALTRLAMPLDRVFLLILFFSRAMVNLSRVQKQYQAMVACESAFWSMRETIDRSQAQAEQHHGSARPELTRGISLRDVHFSYGEHPILDGVSLEIPAGSIVGIIGPSGSGKTSIADLVIGLLRPQQGDVWLDETPLAEVDMPWWRSAVGYVPQEMLLLHENVRVNVSLGDPEIDDHDVEAALRAAGAWEFVSRLDQGLETPLGERGARVSGGQRQRIAIARALVRRPRLLILDEATAALDPESERGIYDTVRSLKGQMSILAISHQRRLTEVADRIYQLEEGRICVSDGQEP